MKEKRKILKPIGIGLLGLALVVAILLLRTKNVEVVEVQTKVPVLVEPLTLTTYDQVFDYTGIVAPDSIKPIAFKSAGKIESIMVEVGQEVEAGQVLAALDPVDLNFELQAAQSSLNAARAQLNLAIEGATAKEREQARLVMEQALEVADYQEATLADLEAMLAEGLVSESEVKGARLQAKVARIDAQNATLTYEMAVEGISNNQLKVYESQLEQAQVQVDAMSRLVEESTLIAPEAGVIVSVEYEEGTMINAGYPVVVMRNDEVLIQVGVRDEDLKQIELNQEVKVTTTNGQELGTGTVIRKAAVPDQDHHLYQVEVGMGIDSDRLLVGEVVHLEIIIGQGQGYLVPIDAIIIEDQDYIYVNQEGLAHKIQVVRVGFLGAHAIVEGDLEGLELITTNMSKLYEGRTISTVE